eukprot:scaffold11311_cov52-Phaeocystis_antarctica.AAC.1
MSEKAALKAKMLALQAELSKLKDTTSVKSGIVPGNNGSPRLAPAKAPELPPSSLSAPTLGIPHYDSVAVQPKLVPDEGPSKPSGRAALDAAKAARALAASDKPQSVTPASAS